MKDLKHLSVPKWVKKALDNHQQQLRSEGITLKTGKLEELFISHKSDRWASNLKKRGLKFNPPSGIAVADDDLENVRLYTTHEAYELLETTRETIKNATGTPLSHSQLFVDKFICHCRVLQNFRIEFSKKKRPSESSDSSQNS